MSKSLQEKRKTAENANSSVITARVIANYGDPGLDEDYQFDILSRYVIVALESIDRVPTLDRWMNMIAVVQRPKHLWIDVVGDVQGNPTDQQRADQLGNTNTGLSSGYSINSIARINQPYEVGEIISLKKLSEPLKLNNQDQDNFFASLFSNNPDYYNSWYNSGAILPYIQASNATNQIRLKTLAKAPNTGLNNFYYPILNKYQYEAFMLLQNNGNIALTNTLTQIFNGSWNGTSQLYNANGGYIFNQGQSIDIPLVEYEDINVGQKARIGSNDCIPLIVATPNQFPQPKSRTTGTINYNPTVVQVSG